MLNIYEKKSRVHWSQSLVLIVYRLWIRPRCIPVYKRRYKKKMCVNCGQGVTLVSALQCTVYSEKDNSEIGSGEIDPIPPVAGFSTPDRTTTRTTGSVQGWAFLTAKVSNIVEMQEKNICLKGIVQRILTEVNTMLKYSVLVNWRSARFSFQILKGHHHKRNIKPFSAA